MFWKIFLIVIGSIILAIPFIQLIFRCSNASDVTWTLGQPGGMKTGLWLYLTMVALGAGLLVWGICI